VTTSNDVNTSVERPGESSGESDEILVLRSQLGDRSALEQLVGRWNQPVRELLRHITLDSDAAQELTQETWLSALRSLTKLREPVRFRWWLFTIARRRAHDRFRHVYRNPTSPSPPEELVDIAVPGRQEAWTIVVDQRDQIIDLLGDLD